MGLFLALLLLVPLTLFFIVPLSFALTNLRSLLTFPVELVRVAFDKRRRRNHALEHATVNVLEQRFGRSFPINGFAEQDGFFIQGAPSPQLVHEASHEALRRLQAGEKQLAIHATCGTNVVSGQVLSLLTFFGVLALLGNFAFTSLLLAMLVAILVARTFAQSLGMFLQRNLTTSTDVQGLHIDRLEAQMPTSGFAIMIINGVSPVQYRVWTQDIAVEAGSTSGPKRFKAY